MGVIIKVRREEGSQRDLMDQASWDTVALPTSEQEVGTQSPSAGVRPGAQGQQYGGYKGEKGTKYERPEQLGDRSYPHAFKSRQSPQWPQGTEGSKGFDGCHIRIL